MKGKKKQRISLALSRDVLKAVDRLADTRRSRSAFIEATLRHYLSEVQQSKLRERERAKIHARDLEPLNRFADVLNAEAEDTLEYQADPWRREME